MPFVPVPNTAQINIVYALDGQEIENVVYYTKTTTPILEDLAALTDEVRAYIVSSLLPALSSAIQLVRVVGVLLDVVDGFTVTNTTGLPASGGDSGDVLPNNVALCISVRTANRGRSFRGRNYIPGIAKTHTADSEFTTSAVTGLVGIWEGLTALAGDAGWTRTVVSRFSGHAPRTTGIATPVTAVFAVDNVVDSQRRRLPGRGR